MEVTNKQSIEREKEIIQELIEFAINTKYLDIPQEVLDYAKGLTLKTVGGMVVGSSKPAGRKMSRLIRDQKLADDVGVIGCGFRTALWEATLLHAFFAHASELEDNRITAWGKVSGGSSWDITVLPLLFSLAQKLRLSGKALLSSIAVGLEVHSRVNLFSAEHLGVIFIPGAAGPAIAAARVMGLDARKATQALGLATSNIPLSHMNFGTDAHYFESATHSLQGIMAAEMAREDMTGNPRMIKYLKDMMGADKVEPEKIVKDLGKKWIFTETWYKKYPVCFLTHRHIDAFLDLKKQKDLKYEDVESIEADISPIDQQCNRPEPKNEEDLQFSFQNVLSAALLDGDVNLTHVTEEAVHDPKYVEARKKIQLIPHNDWPNKLNDAMLDVPSIITVTMKDGKKYTHERWRIIGSPEDPLTMDQIKGLYSKFTQGLLSEEHIEKTMDAIVNMEKLSDVDEMMDILVYRHRV